MKQIPLHPDVELALNEAGRLADQFQSYIEPEHLLIALMRLPGESLPKYVHRIAIQPGKFADELERSLSFGERPASLGKIPQTERTRSIFDGALDLAASKSHPFVTVEHLFVGLLEFDDDQWRNRLRTAAEQAGTETDGGDPDLTSPIATDDSTSLDLEASGFEPDSTAFTPLPDDRIVWSRDIANARPRCLQWSPDGRYIVVGDDAGGVSVWDGNGERRWHAAHQAAITSVAWHPDANSLYAVSQDCVWQRWDARTGQAINSVENQSWMAPLAVAVSSVTQVVAVDSFSDVFLCNEDLQKKSGPSISRDHQVMALAWSPIDRRLAILSRDGNLCLVESDTRKIIWQVQFEDDVPRLLAWNPKGDSIIVATHRGAVQIFSAARGEVLARLTSQLGGATGLACSPDGKWVVSGGLDGVVRFWAASSGWEVDRLDLRPGILTSVAFSPDGRHVITSDTVSRIRRWDVSGLQDEEDDKNVVAYIARQAATVGRRVGISKPDLVSRGDVVRVAAVQTLPSDLEFLPAGLAALHRLDIYPPLSLLRDVLNLTGGRRISGELGALASNRMVRELSELRWPTAARIGIAAIMLRSLPRDGWKPPSRLGPGALIEPMAMALHGESCKPTAPVAPLSLVSNAVKGIDGKVIALLTLLGPEAVAKEPGLPLRILAANFDLTPLSRLDRKLLGLRISFADNGPATGTNRKGNYDGITRRGQLSDLLTTQFALPPPVFNMRYFSNELLYRARQGAEPPRLRPTVVVLDVSPAVFGHVEAVTRLAAYIVLRSLLNDSVPALLVTGVQAGDIEYVDEFSSVVKCWSARSLRSVSAAKIMRLARTLAMELDHDGMEPIVLVFSHEWFGTDVKPRDRRGVRGLLVKYPNDFQNPPAQELFERYHLLKTDELDRLPSLLSRLLA